MNKFEFLFLIALCGTCTSSVIVEEPNRISGASPANDGQYSYMVSLQRVNESSIYTRGHRCGGALVTLRYAVTAASCLYDHLNGVPTQINPNDYRVFAGAASLLNDASADRHRSIDRFIVNPDYRTGTPFVNDIAMIRLKEEFPSNVVGTVPLSTADASSQQINACVSSGWGAQNNTASVSTQLMHVQKSVAEQQLCSAVYSPLIASNPIAIRDSMICAFTSAMFSSCTGDIGNPLVCGGNLNGVLIQGNGCPYEVTLYEVYTRVSSYRSWINSVTSGVSTFQPGMTLLAVITIVQIITAHVK